MPVVISNDSVMIKRKKHCIFYSITEVHNFILMVFDGNLCMYNVL